MRGFSELSLGFDSPSSAAQAEFGSPRGLAAQFRQSVRDMFSPSSSKQEIDELTEYTAETGMSDESFFLGPKGIKDCIIPKNTRDEWGRVKFLFDGNSFEQAKELCKQTQKPVLILFHDGCKEAIEFGQQTLSHPLIVEAIETHFLPVVINSNAASGSLEESKVAARYCSHRSSTMVRVVNEKGKDIVVQIEDDRCNIPNLCAIMIKALERKEIKVPTYLKLLRKESQALNPKGKGHTTAPLEVVLATKSVARAELDYADVEGVIATVLGRIGSFDVIKITYDGTGTAQSFEGIIRHAMFHHDLLRIYCVDEEQVEAARAEVTKFEAKTHIKIVTIPSTGEKHIKKAHNPKLFLDRCEWKFLPLTPFQATLCNLALSSGRLDIATSMLSPRQTAVLEALEFKRVRRSAIDVEIKRAWDQLENEGVFSWS